MYSRTVRIHYINFVLSPSNTSGLAIIDFPKAVLGMFCEEVETLGRNMPLGRLTQGHEGGW